MTTTYKYPKPILKYKDLNLKQLRDECELDFAHFTYPKHMCSCCYGPSDFPSRYWKNNKVRNDDDYEYILFKNAYNGSGSVTKEHFIARGPISSYYTQNVYIEWRIHDKEKLNKVCEALTKQVGSEFKVILPDDNMHCITLERIPESTETYESEDD